MNSKRKFILPAAELLDRLTVDQIKEILLDEPESIGREIEALLHDIEALIAEASVQLSPRLLRVLIILSQINVHIWYLKDKMQEQPDKYNEHLRLAHQLNGIRNQMKNILLEEFGDKEKGLIRTNSDTDDLKSWSFKL